MPEENILCQNNLILITKILQIRFYKDIKIKAFLFMLCFAHFMFSQVVPAPNIQPLDAKNGINKFKLCSFFEIHKVNLKEMPAKDEVHVKWYTYTGTDVPTVFDYKVKQLDLGYYKNKLYKILVQFDGTEKEEVDGIKSKLELLFGTGKEIEKDNDPTHKYAWEATKVYLYFEHNDKEINLFMSSKILGKQIILDEL
jgi:hypothetical protein